MQAIILIWAVTATVVALVFWVMWGRCLHVTMQAAIEGLNESTTAMREVAGILSQWHDSDELSSESNVATNERDAATDDLLERLTVNRSGMERQDAT